jgi:hypothetical protein
MEQVVECIERPVLERFGQQMMTTTVFFLPRINFFAIFFSALGGRFVATFECWRESEPASAFLVDS